MATALTHCKRWLAGIWFTGFGVIFFIVLVQTQLGHYREDANQVWGWLLPTVMPTLSLIIGVLVLDAARHERRRANTDRFLFLLTAWLSGAYLTSVLLVIVLQPLSSATPLQAMAQSNVWLGPFQGLVAAAMGAFFVRAAQDGASAAPAGTAPGGIAPPGTAPTASAPAGATAQPEGSGGV